MKNIVLFITALSLSCFSATGQSVINTKGTRIGLDTSKWQLSGQDIFTKNTGNVGIGISAPLYKLDINSNANPLRLTGLQPGLVSDSILTIQNGVVRYATIYRMLNDSSLYKCDGTLATNRTVTQNGKTMTFATGGASFNITGLPGGSATDSVITLSSSGQLRNVSIGRLIIDSSIYKYDGALTGSRTLSMGSNNLTLNTAGGDFIFNTSGTANMGIGTTAPAGSALLDITSTTAGVLVPRMTTAQRTSITSPANGLLVYDTTTNSFWVYRAGLWVQLISGVAGVNTGNNGAAYTTSHVLAASENGSILEFNSASSLTLTVPSGLPAGFMCSITQLGTGSVMVVGSGVTVKNAYNYTRTATQYSKIGIEITSTGIALLSGDAQ